MRAMHVATRVFAVFISAAGALFVPACVGSISDAEGPDVIGQNGGNAPASSTGSDPANTPVGSGPNGGNPGLDKPGISGLRMLTQDEYSNTIRDLLHGQTVPTLLLPDDVTGDNGFR